MIPYAQTYTTTMTGRVLRPVTCLYCRGEYVYQIERQAQGEGTSMLFLDNSGAQARAAAAAEAKLQAVLDAAHDPVPCPDCLRYQPLTVPLVRAGRLGWAKVLGVVLLVGAAVGFMVAMVQMNAPAPDPRWWALPGGLTLVGAGLLVWRLASNGRWDPNEADEDARRAVAAARAVRRSELEAMMREEGDAEPTPAEPTTEAPAAEVAANPNGRWAKMRRPAGG